MKLPNAEKVFFMHDGWPDNDNDNFFSSYCIYMSDKEAKSWRVLKKRIIAVAKEGIINLSVIYNDPSFSGIYEERDYAKKDRLIKRLNKFARRLKKKNYSAEIGYSFLEISLNISWQL